MSPRRLRDLDRRERRRAIAAMVGRSLLTVVAVIGLYYLLPLNGGTQDATAIVHLAIGSIFFIGVIIFVVRRILNADLPQLRAVEALAVSLALFVVLFAATYLSMSTADPANFNVRLDRTGSLYFTIVTLGTVGYGDITPATNLARLLVSAQIMVDLVFVAVVLRVIVGAARSSLDRRGDDG